LDPQIKNLLLYQAELRGRFAFVPPPGEGAAASGERYVGSECAAEGFRRVGWMRGLEPPTSGSTALVEGTLYLRPDRPVTFWARWKDSRGKGHNRNTGTADREAAERFLAAETGKVHEDVVRGVREVTAREFADGDFFPIFARSAAPSHVAGVRAKIDRFAKWTGARPLHAITRNDVEKFLARIQESSADEDARPALTLLADLGLRCGELLSLTWAHVADDNAAVAIARSAEQRRGTKSGKSRVVPVPARSRAVLAKLRSARVVPMIGADLVLPQIRKPSKRRARTSLRSKSWIESAFRKAAKAAEFPVRPDVAVGVRPHDLRHAYASALARNGVALSVVAKLIGDSIAVTGSRYAHHVPQNEAVRAVTTLERRPAAEGTSAQAAVPAPAATKSA